LKAELAEFPKTIADHPPNYKA